MYFIHDHSLHNEHPPVPSSSDDGAAEKEGTTERVFSDSVVNL